jgi:SAM-dependent methyltransferase
MGLFLKRRLVNFLFEGMLTYDCRWRVRPYLAGRRRILDVGAMRSPLTQTTDPRKVRIFALDIPWGRFGFRDRVLDKLRARKNVTPIFGNAERLPFRDETFDMIIMTEVLEHVSDDASAASELARVLQKGGVLFLTVPHLERIPLEGGIEEHLRHYLKGDLERLFGGRLEIVELVERFKGKDAGGPFQSLRPYGETALGRAFFWVVDFLWRVYFMTIHVPIRERWFPYRQPGANLVLVARKA